jgi:hypothetical protein
MGELGTATKRAEGLRCVSVDESSESEADASELDDVELVP